MALLPAVAQTISPLLQEAEKEYEAGRFEQVDDLLADKVGGLRQEEQMKAYRLLALSQLQLGEKARAEEYVLLLLRLSPSYSAYGENPRFYQLVEQLKKSNSTLTTASKISESAEEAPVPVTIITAEMIQASGAAKLQDVLLLYVPGLSAISGMNDNVAMRGIYGINQETILMMVNGIRMNNYSTNACNFDYSQSVDKIKQIEVLRGPASSLYGNVALTAVINIITYSGSESGSGNLSLMTNTDGSSMLNGMKGAGSVDSEFFVWGNAGDFPGESIVENGTVHYLDRYSEKSPYDLGMRIRWKDLCFNIMAQQSHKAPYYSMMEFGSEYTYDDYGESNGSRPGATTSSRELQAEYNHFWKHISISADAHSRNERYQIYNVFGDEVSTFFFYLPNIELPDDGNRGFSSTMMWEGNTLGTSGTATLRYKSGGGMESSLLVGMQAELYDTDCSSMLIGTNYDNATLYTDDILQAENSEITVSTYAQLKHYFSRKLIVNGGLRYDNKSRTDLKELSTVSPRLSVIWRPLETTTVKIGHSQSFVDVPVYSRSSKLVIFSGGSELEPEKMNSFQLSAGQNFKRLGLTAELNAFYNDVRNMIYFNIAGANTLTAIGNESTFLNAEKITQGGLEATLQYHRDHFFANLNGTWQRSFEVVDFPAIDGQLCNIPNFIVNATASKEFPLRREHSSLLVRANVHAQSGTENLQNDILSKVVTPYFVLSDYQKAYAVLGAGVQWNAGEHLSLALDGSNLLNQSYRVGGILKDGVPGKSRTLMLRLKYSL